MRRARWRLRMTAEMARDYVQMWWADVGVILADWWRRHSPGAAGRRMDAIYAEVSLLERRLDFLLKALKDVVGEEPSPGVKPLAAVKGVGCRSAPRRPALQVVKGGAR